jgi:PAS domain S-box-containing protein
MNHRTRTDDGAGRATPIDIADLARQAFDLIADGVIVVDNGGTILWANRPAADLFGFSVAELVGASIDTLVPTPMRAAHRRDRIRFAASGEKRPMGRPDLDIEGQRADGSRFPIDVQLAPVPGRDAIAATVRDMTKQRHVTVDRAIDRLDLAIAHDRVGKLVTSHDRIVQELYALAAHLRAKAIQEPAAVSAALFDASHTVDDLVTTIRRDALDNTAERADA